MITKEERDEEERRIEDGSTFSYWQYSSKLWNTDKNILGVRSRYVWTEKRLWFR